MAWCHLAPHQIAQLDRFNRLRAVFRFDRRARRKTRQLQRLAEHKIIGVMQGPTIIGKSGGTYFHFGKQRGCLSANTSYNNCKQNGHFQE